MTTDLSSHMRLSLDSYNLLICLHIGVDGCSSSIGLGEGNDLRLRLDCYCYLARFEDQENNVRH